MSRTNRRQKPFIIRTCIAITTDEFDRLSDFYRIGMGLEPTEDWGEEGGRNYVVDMGTATLEVVDEKQANTIDQVEVGERVSGRFRFALQVPDLDAAIDRLTAHGAEIVHPAMETPWGDRTARVRDPEGMHLTLFESPDRDENG